MAATDLAKNTVYWYALFKEINFDGPLQVPEDCIEYKFF